MLLHDIYIKNTTKRLEKIIAKHRYTPYTPKPHSLLYVAANCLPYHISGYTTRTHEILTALKKQGVDVHVLTRAGYPWDHTPTACKAGPLMSYYQGITYHHAKHPRKFLCLMPFVYKAAKVIAEHAKKHQVACIHAASNYVNALPALVAARWLDIPFQYEMRGHWELSRKSQCPWYAYSFAYHLGLHLEQWVAQKAHRIFCISKALAQFANLQVDDKKVYLLPNCVDSGRIRPSNEQDISPRHIGYAGALVSYEGLDILLHALNELKKQEKEFFLHIVGHGKVQAKLLRLAQQLNIHEQVHFYGKKAPEEARALMEQCALICIPRAPFEVCKVVPPIKLVEAMALGKAVVLPNLPVFQEEAHKIPAFFFEAGNAKHLAQVLKKALNNTENLIQYGQQCREYVLQHRQWEHFVSSILPQKKL